MQVAKIDFEIEFVFHFRMHDQYLKFTNYLFTVTTNYF